MEIIKVESSNVGYIHYCKDSKRLTVAFNDGDSGFEFEDCRIYVYYEVEEEVFEELCASESKGSYICAEIAYQYKYELI